MVEQERKQEVNAAETLVVLSRPADPIGGCSFVVDAQSEKQMM